MNKAQGKLGELIRLYRVFHNKDLRAVAKEIGISPPSVMRLEHGRDTDARTFVRVLDWLTRKES